MSKLVVDLLVVLEGSSPGPPTQSCLTNAEHLQIFEF